MLQSKDDKEKMKNKHTEVLLAETQAKLTEDSGGSGNTNQFSFGEIIQRAENKYRTLFESIDEGFCIIEVIFNEKQEAIDYRFLEANPAFIKQTSLQNAIGKRMKELTPGHEEFWYHVYGDIAKTGEPKHFEYFASQLAGGTWYDVYAFRIDAPQNNQVAVLFDDITERKRREQDQLLLNEISKDLVALDTIEETMERLGKKIGDHFGVKWCMFSELVDEETSAVYGWNAENVPSIKGTYKVRDFFTPELSAANNAGKITVVSDIQADTQINRKGFEALGVRSIIIIPQVRGKQWQFQFSIIHNEPRQWREDEIQLAQEITNRIWARLERARTEEALRKSEEQLRLLNASLEQQVVERTGELKEQSIFISKVTNTVPDMISVMDLSTKAVRFINKETFMARGFDLDIMMKLTHQERRKMIHKDDHKQLDEYYSRLSTAEDEEIVTAEYRSKNMLNEWGWFLVRGKVFRRDEKGKPLEILNVIQDITEQKRSEERIIRQHRLLTQAEELAQAGSWEYDVITKEFTWSDGMYHLFGMNKGEPIKPAVYIKYTLQEDQPIAKKIVDAIQENFGPFEETIQIKPNGSIKTLRIKAAPFKNEKGEVEKMLGVDIDITNVRSAEKTIMDLNRNLMTVNRELRSVNEDLQTFTTIAAGNYTETLRQLYINLELIVNNDARNLSNSGRANLRRAQASIQKMKLVTDDLVSFSRLQQLGGKEDKVDLNTILREVVGNFEKQHDHPKIKIDCDNMPDIAGYPFLVSMVFHQLIDNAIKFRRNDNDHIIHVSCKEFVNAADIQHANVQQNIQYHVIIVSDNGIGFPPEENENIFKMFYRLHEKGLYRGSGNGLAIVKKIMEMHGGFITAQGNAEPGAIFLCYFPIYETIK